MAQECHGVLTFPSFSCPRAVGVRGSAWRASREAAPRFHVHCQSYTNFTEMSDQGVKSGGCPTRNRMTGAMCAHHGRRIAWVTQPICTKADEAAQ